MKDMSNQPDRSTQIIRTSWIGIAANVLLAAFKAGVGGRARRIRAGRAFRQSGRHRN